MRPWPDTLSCPGAVVSPRWVYILTIVALCVGVPAASAAQIRPLEPMPWRVFDPATTLSLDAGVGLLHGQRASLAGTSGSLLEIGNFVGAWRSGRMAIEIGGTVYRRFEDRERYGEPHPSVSNDGPRRTDSGDYNVGTLLRLTPEDAPGLLAIRFGTRLPNSDDETGIDRDRTDFYALLGGRLRRGQLRVSAEAGVGIFGSHDLDYEQADPLLYSVTSEYSFGVATLHGTFLGHRAGFGGWVQRGNESRSEARMGVGVGHRHRLQLLYVHGLAQHSPSRGWLLSVGASR
ncbi:hypothetical protein BH23GEM8_BH23GEM8_13870 [soil metagenome]